MLKYRFHHKIIDHWIWSELFMPFSYEAKQYLFVYRACYHDFFAVSSIIQLVIH